MQLQVSDSFLNERTNRFNRSARGIDTGENLAFSPNGRWRVTGHDGAVGLWDMKVRLAIVCRQQLLKELCDARPLAFFFAGLMAHQDHPAIAVLSGVRRIQPNRITDLGLHGQ